MIDLRAVPYDDLRSELARRLAERRTRFRGGRPPRLVSCLKCRELLTASRIARHKCGKLRPL